MTLIIKRIKTVLRLNYDFIKIPSTILWLEITQFNSVISKGIHHFVNENIKLSHFGPKHLTLLFIWIDYWFEFWNLPSDIGFQIKIIHSFWHQIKSWFVPNTGYKVLCFTVPSTRVCIWNRAGWSMSSLLATQVMWTL